MNTLQRGDFEQWGSNRVFHNLLLKPDIKVFDGVRVKSWFQFAPPPPLDSSQNTLNKKFHFQKGSSFGLDNKNGFSAPLIAVRDMYLEVAHDFGLFQIGWKPHHFGLGIYYNDSSAIFSPIYNLEGSTGFVSWRGFIGSSYYIQPMVHYIKGALFNLFIQAGFSADQYGIEAMYKTSPQGIQDDSQPAEEAPSYFGFYGYYKMSTFTIQLEAGRTSDEVYGGVIDIDWQTPVKWLDVGLDLGVATSNEGKAFYFDPSFSYHLSAFIAQYEILKSKKEEYLKEYLGYSFNSAMYIAPVISFLILDSLSLESIFSAHFSDSAMDILLTHAELTLKYQLAENFMWKTSVGILFPEADHWHIGVISQAAITF